MRFELLMSRVALDWKITTYYTKYPLLIMTRENERETK